MSFESFVSLLVFRVHPPTELRIVESVEVEPRAQIGAQLAETDRGAIEHGRITLAPGCFGRGDIGVQLDQDGCGFLAVNRLHTAARFFESDDCLLKRDQLLDLGILFCFVGELLLLAFEPALQE